ncbi:MULTISPECIES: hypothetical protein [Vibrio]|uniref:hypothetical protein n=1 Tax=Vibrio TaxID=662 RepID=UPI001E492953|nr:hypothetical protein [Vibrio lentus]MCC4838114.1 hypothetical protein [Vibrio lentus]
MLILLGIAVGFLGFIAWCVFDIRAYADLRLRYEKANILLMLESTEISGEKKDSIMRSSGLAPEDL